MNNKKRAYDKLFVEYAQDTIAHAFNYAVNKMGYSLEEFTELFLSYKYIHLLEDGNPSLVAGKSGVELALDICGFEDEDFGDLEYRPGLEFWIGWTVSYYQWYRNISYKEIFEKFPLEKLRRAYPTFHECYEEKMYEYMNSVIQRG